NIRPEITIVDQCETPLMLNRWYAERAALAITTTRSNLLQYATSTPFDLICTHSLLSELPPARRPALLANWRTLLRPGGCVVTVNRLRPDGGSMPIGFTPDQAAAFVAAVRAKAQT